MNTYILFHLRLYSSSLSVSPVRPANLSQAQSSASPARFGCIMVPWFTPAQRLNKRLDSVHVNDYPPCTCVVLLVDSLHHRWIELFPVFKVSSKCLMPLSHILFPEFCLDMNASRPLIKTKVNLQPGKVQVSLYKVLNMAKSSQWS